MKTGKRKTYSKTEKTLLLETYKSSGKKKKQWCQENGLGLSTLERWHQQEKKQTRPQPVQSWIPVMATAPEASKVLEIQIGKCKISVDDKTDKKLLADVLSVLVEVC